MTDTNETIAAEAKPATKRSRKMAREPKVETGNGSTSAAAPSSAKHHSKADLVLNLLQRAEGATIDCLVAATGWLPHTARAALTGLKKKGHEITSDKPAGGVRTYHVRAAAEAAQ